MFLLKKAINSLKTLFVAKRRKTKMRVLLPIIILSSVGLAACLCYIVYRFVLYRREKSRRREIPPEETFEYKDEYEDGDSLVINFK